MQPDIQAAVAKIWPTVNTGNLNELTDFGGYQKDFLELFGFGLCGVDYTVETEVEHPLPSAEG